MAVADRPHPGSRLRRRAGDRRAHQGRADIGAVVTFTGICRERERRAIAALTLEHYPGMAEAEIERHADEAMRAGRSRLHRHPPLRPARARREHRARRDRLAAPAGGFEAAEFLMDYLKTGRRSGRARKAPRQRAGSKPATTTTPPPRAGPNPDGQARKPAAHPGRPSAKSPKVRAGELQTLLDFVRYARAASTRPSWCSRMAPPIRWPRQPSSSARRCICIPTSSRTFPTPASPSRRQEDPRPDRAPGRDPQTGRLSRQQGLHARPAVLRRRAHHRAALLYRRIARFALRRR